MQEAFLRHQKAALMFSGGKDSLACLFLLKPYWDKITVIWVNTGNIFPENEAIVRRFAAMVPSFLEIKTDVNSFKEKFGLPTDLLPIQNTEIAAIAKGQIGMKLVNGYDCCSQNIWLPAFKAAYDIGATLIIRGQRNEEAAKSTVRSGDIMGTAEFLFPIENWTQKEVLFYLKEQGFDYPEFFNFAESSLDCINCTAFLSGISDRKEYMQKYHPLEYEKNKQNLRKIINIAEEELTFMIKEVA